MTWLLLVTLWGSGPYRATPAVYASLAECERVADGYRAVPRVARYKCVEGKQ